MVAVHQWVGAYLLIKCVREHMSATGDLVAKRWNKGRGGQKLKQVSHLSAHSGVAKSMLIFPVVIVILVIFAPCDFYSNGSQDTTQGTRVNTQGTRVTTTRVFGVLHRKQGVPQKAVGPVAPQCRADLTVWMEGPPLADGQSDP
uniref:Uncharacterized protein n=1 Tax=Eutreptiella gymnastica TaxID=73025 RepID=A0A7S1HSH1_9EUGL